MNVMGFLTENVYLLVAEAVGAGMLWNVSVQDGKGGLRLSPTIAAFIDSPKWRIVVEAGIFIVIGTFVSYLLTFPQTPQQAFAAGLGWTSLVSSAEKKFLKAHDA